MLLALFLLFLAQAANNSQAAQTGWIVIVVCTLAGVVSNILICVFAARRTPPIGEQLHGQFATKAEVNTVRIEAADSVRRIHTRIDEIREAMAEANEISALARGTMIGQLEGISEQLAHIQKHQ